MANTTLTQTGAEVQAILDKADNLPSSLGTAGQVLAVNSGATGMEWKTPGGGMKGYNGSLTIWENDTRVIVVKSNGWDDVYQSSGSQQTYTLYDVVYMYVVHSGSSLGSAYMSNVAINGFDFGSNTIMKTSSDLESGGPYVIEAWPYANGFYLTLAD